MGRSPKTITTILFMCVFFGVMDVGAVVPALTAIIQEWAVPYQWGIWTMTLYLLLFVVSMPVMRRLSEQFGGHTVLFGSLILFGVGAALSGLSPNYSVLLLGRSIQGVSGGGLLISASLAFDRQETRSHPLLIVLPFAAGAIAVFLLGSLFVTLLHWRWIFYAQALFVVVAAVPIFRKPVKSSFRRGSFDIVGLVLLTCIALSLMTGLTSLKPAQFWTSLLSPDVLPFVAVGLGLIIPFMMVERQHDAPLLLLHEFYQWKTVLVYLIAFFSGVSWISLLFLPAFTENLLRQNPGTGGYLLTIIPVAAAISITLTELITERIRSRLLMTVGLFFVSVGFLLLGTVADHFWTLVLAGTLLGLGFGAMVREVLREAAAASLFSRTTTYFFQVIGAATGAAFLVTFLTQATDKIPKMVRASLVVTSPNAEEVSGGVFADLVAGSSQFMVPNAESLKAFIPDHIAASTQELILRQTMTVMRETLTEGYQDLFLTASIFSLIGFVCAMSLFRLDEDEGQSS